MFVGLVATIPIPETKKKSLEEISNDYVQQEWFFEYNYVIITT